MSETKRSSRKRRTLGGIALLSLAALLVAESASAWQPVIGIPTPQWPADLDVAAPAFPNPWTSEQAGYYYVERSAAGCSDSRAYGYPGNPRCTLPSSPGAGSVVAVHGTYAATANIGWSGTSGSPIWMRAYNMAQRPTFTQPVGWTGSYVITDGITVSWNADDGCAVTGHHIMVRNSSFANAFSQSGNNGSGLGVSGQNVVFYANVMDPIGNWTAGYGVDTDRHCVKVSGGADSVWFVDSRFAHCEGDGIQVGDQNNAPSQINRIYVARNTAYQNTQSCFWTKNATDVIFSENICHDIDYAVGGSGQGLGGQYDAKYVWFLANRIYNTKSGIKVSGASSGGGGPWYMIGNVVYAVESNQGGCNNYDMGALAWRNQGGVTMLFNTLHDADMFVGIPTGSGITIKDNIFSSKRNTGCSALDVDVSFVHDYNLFSASGYDPGSEAHKVTANPQFTNAAAADFSLQAGSPAINAASPAEEPAFAAFQSRYGIDIRRDMAQTSRPQSTGWDIGAYESTYGGGTSRTPNPPTSVQVQ